MNYRDRSPVAVVALEGIGFERDGVAILTGVDWRIAPGEHWVVFGPNGSGKTTLLNLILGYEWPTAGNVTVLGGRLGRGVDVRDLRRRIGVVGDGVRDMVSGDLTGLETIVTGPRAHLRIFDDPTPAELDHARATAARLAVPDRLLDRRFGVMSTGERQRVLVARAMAAAPELLVLDEPCHGLDLAGREMLLETLARAALPCPDGTPPPAQVLTTHHVEEIGAHFTHALLLSEGQVSAQGTMNNVFTSAGLSALFGIGLVVTHEDGRWTARAKGTTSLHG